MVTFRGSAYCWVVNRPALRLGEHLKLAVGCLLLYQLAMQLVPRAVLYPSVMAPQSASEGQQNI